MSERDPGEGFFDHLDDPATPSPGRDALDSVMARGRVLRTRRHTAWTASAMAGVTAAVLGGLGISHAINADGSSDTVVPAHPSPSVSETTTPRANHRHGGKGAVPIGPGATLAPGAQPPATNGGSPTTAPSPADTCAPATAEPPSDTIIGATLPPVQPAPSPSCPPAESPTATPSSTASPEPTDTAEPTTSPS